MSWVCSAGKSEGEGVLYWCLQTLSRRVQRRQKLTFLRDAQGLRGNKEELEHGKLPLHDGIFFSL